MIDHVMEKREWGEYVAEIVHDNYPENPRDESSTWGTMWCWHKSYHLGSREERRDTRRPNPGSLNGWDEVEKAIMREIKPVVILPIFMYDHSGISLSPNPFSCPWDSGQVGYIFAERKVLKDFGAKIATAKVKAKIEDALKGEIREYSAYSSGETYYWRLLKDDEVVDSCSGYYGDDFEYMFECAKASMGAELSDSKSLRGYRPESVTVSP